MWSGLGVLWTGHRLDQAIEAYNKAIELKPDYADAYYNMGLAYSGQSLGSSSSQGVSLGDVDDDGDLDAFVSNSNQGNKVWINDGRSDVGDITLNQAEAGAYTLTHDGTNTFSLSRDGGTAVDYALTTDPASTGSPLLPLITLSMKLIRNAIGSGQNKLQFTMSNLTSQTQSIEAARSSIQDTDFATDAADLAKNQILAQASAISQNILSLIAA